VSLLYIQEEKDEDLKNVLLIDNQSTTDLFCNRKLLSNIRKVSGQCTVVTNGGNLYMQLQGTLRNYGDMWYHPDTITNILSLNNVKKIYKVTYDSTDADCCLVYKPEKIVKFTPTRKGLYVHHIYNVKYLLVNTVEENVKKFTKRQIERADVARRLYGIVGYPSLTDFKNMIKK
jgi:hypothetical protein